MTKCKFRWITVFRAVYLVAVIYYLLTADVLSDIVLIATGLFAFVSPAFYYFLVGLGLFLWPSHQ